MNPNTQETIPFEKKCKDCRDIHQLGFSGMSWAAFREKMQVDSFRATSATCLKVYKGTQAKDFRPQDVATVRTTGIRVECARGAQGRVR